MFTAAYDAILYNPLLNGLIVLYNTAAFQDLGIAIIMLTVLIRLVLFPLFQKGVRYQAVMQELQPKLQEIQKQHKDDKEKQLQATLALYREYRMNPLAGFAVLFLQLPVLIALYQIFLHSLSGDYAAGLYAFVSPPQELREMFLGLINLGKPSILMVVLAACAQYVQAYVALPRVKPGQELSAAQKTSRRMAFIAPVLTVVFFFNLPSAVALYWLTSSVFSVGQQLIFDRRHGQLGNLH